VGFEVFSVASRTGGSIPGSVSPMWMCPWARHLTPTLLLAVSLCELLDFLCVSLIYSYVNIDACVTPQTEGKEKGSPWWTETSFIYYFVLLYSVLFIYYLLLYFHIIIFGNLPNVMSCLYTHIQINNKKNTV